MSTKVAVSSVQSPRAEGLDGIVVAETRLSHVDGEKGQLVIAGHDIETWAFDTPFEAAVSELWQAASLNIAAPLTSSLGQARQRAAELLPQLSSALRLQNAMAALAACTLQLPDDGDPTTILGGLAVFAAAWARTQAAQPWILPQPTASHAADFLTMLGASASPAQVTALNSYWVTVLDHGLNASTFAVRVVASTGSDAVSATGAGIAALKGPLHGGAPGPVLDMLDAIASAHSARHWLDAELRAGHRIMGMGHRIYRVRDPRALVLERAVERLQHSLASEGSADTARVRQRLDQARHTEQAAEQLLTEKYPERRLRANVEFYTAVLLEALGIPRDLFSATFAIARAGGWLAHFAEQRLTGRLLRPASRYIGPLPQPN